MRALAGALGAALLVPVLVLGAALGAAEAEPTTGLAGGPMPALADVPAERLALYQEAAGAFAVPWEVVAAVGKVECDHGRDVACMVPNFAGAAGPMQFLPGTWARYAHASASPAPSIYDPRDAIYAAAAKLAADRLAADPWAALRSYNPSDPYAATVVAWALAYGWAPTDDALLVRAVLAHPNLALSGSSRPDVARRAVDSRVMAVLLVVATRHELGAVGPFTQHHYYVRGTTRPSNHVFGRAVDVGMVDNERVSVSNEAARVVVETLLGLPEPLRPDELGSPFAEFDPLPGPFTDADHLGHLHIGYEA